MISRAGSRQRHLGYYCGNRGSRRSLGLDTQGRRQKEMKFNLGMLRLVAVVLLVLVAILFFASVRSDVDFGLLSLALACWAVADVKM
jgi:hypothetical protein